VTALLRALAVVAALVVATGARAAEEILSFDVAIDVREDGTLDVTETIRVTVEGDQIKRGIYRDFPVQHTEEGGRVSLATFDVEDVRRNGAAEQWREERNGPYARVYIGRPDVMLTAPSEQVYELRYRTQGQIRSYQDYDELYWNVTGNQWRFPIRAASVEIRLPARAAVLQHAAYTGPEGATGRDFEVLVATDGLYHARTTAPLRRYDGFTVAVGWPPGIVDAPPVRYGAPGLGGFVDPPMMLGGQRLGPLAAIFGALAGAFALLLGWLGVGRDPQKGAIYPQFDPPPGLSPAATRYVKRWGFDPRCLTAAIISMAVKGAVKIVEEPSESLFRVREFRLEPLGAEGRGLSVGEESAYRQLFPTGAPLALKQDKTNGRRMDRAKAELKSKLWDEHYGASFRRNTGYTLAGVAAGLVAALPLIGLVERWNMLSLIQWGGAALLAGLLVYGSGFLWFAISDFRQGGRIEWRRLAKLLPFVAMVGIFPVQALAVLGSSAVLGSLDSGFVVPGAAFGILAGLFHFLMAAPTKAGRLLMDQVEGFELYMRTAEEDRLDILNPPEHTPELFEKLLPYAVALGVSHQWAAKFATVLAATTAAPSWYQGTDRFDPDRLEREFGHAVSSTTTPPSRGSSGSGGGGSSGGGGGGGGGGGW
jgi:uncharacterized membrane protein YgcG